MPEPESQSSSTVHRYPCPGCAANLIFAPQDGCLVCPYCGTREKIPESAGEVEEKSYEAYLKLRPEQLGKIAENALEVECSGCGAKVVFTPPTTARQCDFCGNKMIAQPKSADPMVAPQAVLPFRFTPEQATQSLRDWLASLWFAPNALKRFATPDVIHGVYLPFWTFDTHTTTHYSGERGQHYYETETIYVADAQGRQGREVRQVRKTRWYPASGTVQVWFDDMTVPATRSLPPARLSALEPWDFDQLRPYEAAYLSGFKAQSYQVDLAQGFEAAKELAAPGIHAAIRNDIGGDEQRIHQAATHYSAITFKHLLLPVYTGAYRFRERVFQITVNGRTGEVQGERPYSAAKIALAVLAVILLIVLWKLLSSGQ